MKVTRSWRLPAGLSEEQLMHAYGGAVPSVSGHGDPQAESRSGEGPHTPIAGAAEAVRLDSAPGSTPGPRISQSRAAERARRAAQ